MNEWDHAALEEFLFAGCSPWKGPVRPTRGVLSLAMMAKE
jgi:hypothetical protein